MERRIQTVVPAGQPLVEFLTGLGERFDQIRKRAFELYCQRNPEAGNQFNDWLTAERELFTIPEAAIEATEQNVVLTAPLPGFTAKQLTVTLTDGYVTIGGHAESKQENGTAEERELFLHLPIPEAIDPALATARLAGGLLTVTMPRAVAEPEPAPAAVEPEPAAV